MAVVQLVFEFIAGYAAAWYYRPEKTKRTRG